jgi:hypothetical protein
MTVAREKAWGQKCDFCIPSLPAIWDYPAASFAYEPPFERPFQSLGGWLACARCAELIENNDRRGLEMAGSPVNVAALLHRRRIIALFFKNRLGERVAFG